jgi:hypothetical protein
MWQRRIRVRENSRAAIRYLRHTMHDQRNMVLVAARRRCRSNLGHEVNRCGRAHTTQYANALFLESSHTILQVVSRPKSAFAPVRQDHQGSVSAGGLPWAQARGRIDRPPE